MDQLRNLGDERQLHYCAYCAGPTGTRDHVPSRVLLDEPYPSNLAVVPACEPCNNSLSADEEYFACLLDCTLVGSAVPCAHHRPKVRRILSERPALAARLAGAQRTHGKRIHFEAEAARVASVLVKLARGHALFELNDPQYEEPAALWFRPLASLPDEHREQFERETAPGVSPEVGSRALQRLALTGFDRVPWVTVQPHRYRYLADAGDNVLIRMVLSEYLACEVLWTRTLRGD